MFEELAVLDAQIMPQNIEESPLQLLDFLWAEKLVHLCSIATVKRTRVPRRLWANVRAPQMKRERKREIKETVPHRAKGDTQPVSCASIYCGFLEIKMTPKRL